MIEGKIALVTGASKGIGYAIAESLLQSGAKVFICCRDKGELKQALVSLAAHGTVGGDTCDVRSEEQVKMLIEECSRVFGGLDVLVNNAGMGYFGTSVQDTTGDQFRQTLETNLFGVFYACRYAIPQMKSRKGGYIINISSLAGQNAHPGMAAYNASKFGLNGFSEALMQEVRQDNIKVSWICPGSVNTYFGGDAPSEDKMWQLQPADVAQVVVDLLSMNTRALPSKIELRPSKPPKK